MNDTERPVFVRPPNFPAAGDVRLQCMRNVTNRQCCRYKRPEKINGPCNDRIVEDEVMKELARRKAREGDAAEVVEEAVTGVRARANQQERRRAARLRGVDGAQ